MDQMQSHLEAGSHRFSDGSLCDDRSSLDCLGGAHDHKFYDPDPYINAESLPNNYTHHSSEDVIDSVFEGRETTDFAIAPSPNNHVTSSHRTVSTCKKHSRTKKHKHPPPSDELVIGYHENDVLSGRGATINSHPGNVRFRKLCVDRKTEFDNATGKAHKRSIATSIIDQVLGLNPPGRFLERSDSTTGAAFHKQHLNSDGAVGLYGILTGSSAAYFKSMGYHNKALSKHIGPWKHLSIEKAIQKVCGVIRDYERPDKIALRMSKYKKVPEPSLFEDRMDDEILTQSEAIIPSPNDILIGRGPFINNYQGNKNFRTLAMQHKNRFDNASGAGKRAISLYLVNQIKCLDPPGRFIKRPATSPNNHQLRLAPRGIEGPWIQVNEEASVNKVCQSLRDLKSSIPTPGTALDFAASDNHIHQCDLPGASDDSMRQHFEDSTFHSYSHHEEPDFSQEDTVHNTIDGMQNKNS